MVIAVSLAAILPVAGTLIALAVLVLLRAGDLAHRGSDQRGPIMSAAAFPFFVVRSLISTVVLAPLALIVAVAAAGLTFLAMPVSPGLHALSYGAGALVAFYAYGPGRARRDARPTGSSPRWSAARACRRWPCSGCARWRSPRSPPR